MSDSKIPDEEFTFGEDMSESNLYECGYCDAIKDLSEFIDTECDGDVIGTCPSCGTRTIIFPVS